MAYAKCVECGNVWHYRAVKGSRLAYQLCPKCGSVRSPIRGSWEEWKKQN